MHSMLVLAFASLVLTTMAARVSERGVAKALQSAEVQPYKSGSDVACSGSKFELTVGVEELAHCASKFVAKDVFTFKVRVGIPDIYSEGSKVSEHVVEDKISSLIWAENTNWHTEMPRVLCLPDLPKDQPVKSMEVQFSHMQPESRNLFAIWPGPWYCGLGTAVERIKRDDKVDLGWTDPQPVRVTMGQSATAKWCSPSQTAQTCPCPSGNPFVACPECPCPVANIPYKQNGTDVVPEMILRKAWVTLDSVDVPKQVESIQMDTDGGGPVAVGMVQGHTIEMNEPDLNHLIEIVDTTVKKPEWCSGCRAGFCDLYEIATIRSTKDLDGMRANLANYCSAKKCDQCTDGWEECDGHPGATPGCSDDALDGMKDLKKNEFFAEVKRLVEFRKEVQMKRQEEEQQIAKKCLHFFSQKACGVKLYSNGKIKTKDNDAKKSCKTHCASVEETEHFKCELDMFFTGESSGEMYFERNEEAVNKKKLMKELGIKEKKSWCTWQAQAWYTTLLTGESMIDKDGNDCTDAWRTCSPDDAEAPCEMSRTSKINGIACKVVEK